MQKQNPEQILRNLRRLFEPAKEIFYGIKSRTIPVWCSLVALGASLLLLVKIDLLLIYKTGWEEMYPFYHPLYRVYYFSVVTSGYWIWAWRQVFRRQKLIKMLHQVFTNSGLISRIGKMPRFIWDYPVDGVTRKIRFTNAGFPKQKFEEVRASLEAGLRVYIDDVKEIREEGAIEIRYSHIPMPTIVNYEASSTKSYQFFVGSTRARNKLSTLRDSPHLLVAGQTGGGKSTFLKQFITHLYTKNSAIQFLLVDLKGGLEFSLFENRRRITVAPNVRGAIKELKRIDLLIEKRMAFLKQEKCKDIDAYLARKKS